MKILKGISIGALLLFLISILIIIISLISNIVKTNNLKDDYSYIYEDPKYEEKYIIDDIELVNQEISCGYAVIEMFAKWDGKTDLTEKALFDNYGGIVTSTGKSFEDEMNKQFNNYHTTMYKYLKNSIMLDKIYNSLKNNIPVPFEWAAKKDDKWTLHYSLIYGIDVKNDLIYILNPYGYKEELKFNEFLERTNYRAYEKMPFYYELAFAFGIFEKNTIFIVEKM